MEFPSPLMLAQVGQEFQGLSHPSALAFEKLELPVATTMPGYNCSLPICGMEYLRQERVKITAVIWKVNCEFNHYHNYLTKEKLRVIQNLFSEVVLNNL